MIRQANQELVPAKRMALYEEAGQISVDDVPAVFAFNLAMVVLIKLEATGYQATASDAFNPGSWALLMTMGLRGWNAGPVARSAPLRRTRQRSKRQPLFDRQPEEGRLAVAPHASHALQSPAPSREAFSSCAPLLGAPLALPEP